MAPPISVTYIEHVFVNLGSTGCKWTEACDHSRVSLENLLVNPYEAISTVANIGVCLQKKQMFRK